MQVQRAGRGGDVAAGFEQAFEGFDQLVAAAVGGELDDRDGRKRLSGREPERGDSDQLPRSS